jgi:hypothetical protein
MSDTIISSMNLCPKCKNASPEGSKFCMQCGTPLQVSIKQKSIKLLQTDSSGKSKKEILIDSVYKFNDSESDFTGFKSKSNDVEIKIDNGKILIKDNGSSGVYLKLNKADYQEIIIGQEFFIDGHFFKVE